MKRYFLVVSILQVLASFNVYSSSGQGALSVYQQGNYREAYSLFKNLAVIGNKDAQFNLGVMHYKGEHVSKDKVASYAWMNLAGNGGKERYGIAANKLYQSLPESSKKEALVAARKLKEKYDGEHLLEILSPEYLSDDQMSGGIEVVREPRSQYPQSAESLNKMGYVKVEFDVSTQGLPRNLQILGATSNVFKMPTVMGIKAALWNPSLGESGKREVYQNAVYHFIYKVQGMNFELSEMKRDLKKYKKKAEKGDHMAQYKHARTLLKLRDFGTEQKGLKIEYQDINRWLFKSALGGNKFAQYWLGKHLLQGAGCTQNRKLGLLWLRAAASAGHLDAQVELAEYLNRSGGDSDREALSWLDRASSSGSSVAKLYLAWELATNEMASAETAGRAQQLLEDLELADYYDDLRVLETRAAVFARLGDFNKAVELQEKAVKKAAVYRWKVPVVDRRLVAYKEQKAWQGQYL